MNRFARAIRALLLGASASAHPAAAQSQGPADAFLANIRAHCGKAYEGRMVNPMPADSVTQYGGDSRVGGTAALMEFAVARVPSGA